MKKGDRIIIRGTVAAVTPNAVIVNLPGPGGASIPFAALPTAVEEDPPEAPAA